MVTALAMLLVVPAIAWSILPGLPGSSDDAGPMMCRVERGDYLHEITERGNVESASNIEVRCEVQSLGSAGTRILWIIPEGTYVKKGQEIVRLDSSALENDRTKQQIVRSNSEAAAIQARSEYTTAEIAKKEYLEGKFRQEQETLESEVFIAEENYRRAEEILRFSEKLAAKGYLTPLQLEADKFSKEQYERARAAAQTKLRVLREYTLKKMELQLQADIDTAKAKLDAAEHTLKLDDDRLKLIEDQIKKCTIVAPDDGQVVYASQTERWGGQETIIEEGATVRERQVIVRLPDPKRMQVKAKINESKIALVAEGQPAAIRVQAYPDLELRGSVQKVNEYPAPGAWYAANIKEYDAIVKIHDSPVALRPGLTAEVKIRVAYQTNVLLVPVQAVFEHGGRHYSVVRSGKGWEARPVEIGPTNEKVVIIRGGLEEGEMVALNAAAFRDEVDLPELPATTAGPVPEGGQAQPGGPAPSGSSPAAEAPSPGRAASSQAGPKQAGPDLPAKKASPDKGKTRPRKRGGGESADGPGARS
ncbi:MAG: HlyD family efflux transporter periplasmic adaptor subunit [Thermoguttaceae bacterium]|nr:HlyD family efflux transporter periplasmic adaptor subunit [Thermoguttaceae bacterium]